MIKKIKIYFKENFLNLIVLVTLFLFISYLILILRIKNYETHLMPELTGKNLLQIYNQIQKFDLRIELRKIYIPEKPNGMIVEQSILPGEIIKPKDKLVLIVNDYEPILKMPKLIGLSLENAQKILDSLPYENKIYKIPIAKIIYVYKKEISPNTVINQFPAENTKISLTEKIILIVSSESSDSIENLKDLEIGPVSQYFIHQNQMYTITEIIKTNDNNLNGKIKEIKKSNQIYEVSVYYNSSKKYSFFSDYELDKFKIKRDQKCEIYTSNKDLENVEDIKQEQKIWFSLENSLSERNIQLVFYRTGTMYVYLLCNDKIVDKEKYRPDFNI